MFQVLNDVLRQNPVKEILAIVVIDARELWWVEPPLVRHFEELVVRHPQLVELGFEVEQHVEPPFLARISLSRFLIEEPYLLTIAHRGTGIQCHK